MNPILVWTLIVVVILQIIAISVIFAAQGLYKRRLSDLKPTLKRTPSLTVLLYCRNDSRTVTNSLDSLIELKKKGQISQVIAVDNASSDKSASIIRKVAAQHPKKTIDFYGKRKQAPRSAAIAQAMRKLSRYKSGFILILDAANELSETDELANYLKTMQQSRADFGRLNIRQKLESSFLSYYRKLIGNHNERLRRLFSALPVIRVDILAAGSLLKRDKFESYKITGWYQWTSNSKVFHSKSSPALALADTLKIRPEIDFLNDISSWRGLYSEQLSTGLKNNSFRNLYLLLGLRSFIVRLVEPIILFYGFYLAFNFVSIVPLTLIISVFMMWAITTIWDLDGTDLISKLRLTVATPSLFIMFCIQAPLASFNSLLNLGKRY